MTKRNSRAVLCFLLLLLLLTLLLSLAPGCRGTLPGDRCTSAADCDQPLVCSGDADAGTLGICVQPEALPDAAVSEDASAA
ncbi:MAG: hypothetical protein ABI333_20515 [bacterium]